MRGFATLLILGSFLGGAPSMAAPAPASQPTASSDTAWSESGEASWYGPRHAGHRTTSGERFDPSQLTAAHPSLPMGSFVRVTVVDTGRSVVVRVNDREPPHGVRCIDLSHAAATRLGIVHQGVADVTLTELSPRDGAAVEVAEAPAAQTIRHLRHKRHAKH